MALPPNTALQPTATAPSLLIPPIIPVPLSFALVAALRFRYHARLKGDARMTIPTANRTDRNGNRRQHGIFFCAIMVSDSC